MRERGAKRKQRRLREATGRKEEWHRRPRWIPPCECVRSVDALFRYSILSSPAHNGVAQAQLRYSFKHYYSFKLSLS